MPACRSWSPKTPSRWRSSSRSRIGCRASPGRAGAVARHAPDRTRLAEIVRGSDRCRRCRRRSSRASPAIPRCCFMAHGPAARCAASTLSHADLLAAAEALIGDEDIRQTDETLAWLPMAWFGDVLTSQALALSVGFTCNCPEDPETARRDLREIGPTILIAPPRIWENTLADIETRAAQATRPEARAVRRLPGDCGARRTAPAGRRERSAPAATQARARRGSGLCTDARSDRPAPAALGQHRRRTTRTARAAWLPRLRHQPEPELRHRSRPVPSWNRRMPEFDLDFTLLLVSSGLMIGLMYALIALGFVLVYKATDAINFAQGEFVMFAAIIAAAAMGAALPFWLAATIALVGMIAFCFGARARGAAQAAGPTDRRGDHGDDRAGLADPRRRHAGVRRRRALDRAPDQRRSAVPRPDHAAAGAACRRRRQHRVSCRASPGSS